MQTTDDLILLVRRYYYNDPGPSDMEIAVKSFWIMAGLMLAGYFALKTLDYFRGRVLRFRPLFDPPESNYTNIGGLCFLPMVAGVLGGWLMTPNWGILLFMSTAMVLLVLDRLQIENQRQLASDLCAEVAQAMHSRVPLDLFFDTITAEYYSVKSLKRVGVRLREGLALSDALIDTGIFPPQALVAIRAGEESGGAALANILRNLSVSLRQENRSTANLLTALLAPLVGWSIALPLGWCVSTVLLGRITDCLRSLGHDTSGNFKVMVSLQFILGEALIGVGIAFVFFSYERTPRYAGVYAWLKQLFSRLPVVGARYRHRCLARSCHALSAMAASGVPLWTALRLVGERDLSGPYATAFRTLADELEKGAPLHAALSNSALPPSVTCLLAAGASGGALPEGFAAAADWHDTRAWKLDNLTCALVPCIAVPLCGVVVGLVYGSVFMMITEIREVVMTHAGLVH